MQMVNKKKLLAVLASAELILKTISEMQSFKRFQKILVYLVIYSNQFNQMLLF